MFGSPLRGNISKNRPSTAVRGTASRFEDCQQQIKRQGAASSKKKAPPSLSGLVRKRDRVKPDELVEFLQSMLQTANRVKNIQKIVGQITEKILKWKQSYGDLDVQEKMVRDRLSNSEDQVIIHNIKTIYLVLQRVQEEIGLTDDEVLIIAFTSIDQDWFNNLLISAGQFTEWFNINFEGET